MTTGLQAFYAHMLLSEIRLNHLCMVIITCFNGDCDFNIHVSQEKKTY